MSGLELALAMGVVTVGALLQGSVGFGLGLFAAPLLLLIDVRLIPAPLLCASFVLTLLLTHRERHGINVGDLGWALGGRVVGVGAAAMLLAVIPAERISLLLAGTILLAVALSASGLHPRPRPSVLVSAGTLSGFMGTAVSVGGPPIALVYQAESGPRIRGTLSAYFTLGVLMSLSALWYVGRFGRAELLLSVGLLPGVLLGFLLSRHLTDVLDRGYTRRAVLIISAAAALAVIARQAL